MPQFSPGTRVYGDLNRGSGYGTIRDPSRDADKQGERPWPYTEKTALEQMADESPDEEEGSRKAINKKKKRDRGIDTLQQLNYHPNSFVNGQTRGLTGIMSGMDPMQVLEHLIHVVAPVQEAGARQVRAHFGRRLIKPVGQGAPDPEVMGSDPTTRTRPGRRTGSKLGWFSPPPPKDTDPQNFEHAYSLQDIARNKDDRAIKNANIITARVRRKNVANEMKIAMLKSYVRLVAGNP